MKSSRWLEGRIHAAIRPALHLLPEFWATRATDPQILGSAVARVSTYRLECKMARSFSQTKKFRDLVSFDVYSLSEEQAWEKFVQFRWGSLEVMPCPDCGDVDKHYVRRTRRQWRCKSCHHIFSVTSGTPFADRKLPFRKLLAIIFHFTDEPMGLAANNLCSTIGVTLRT